MTDDRVEAVVAACAKAGVDWFQTRDRSLEGADLLRWNDSVRRAAGDHARVIANRRVDVALAARLAGVHLGFDAMRPATARALLGRDAIVGRSHHDVAESADGASYIHLAPIATPRSKPATRPSLGFDALRAACDRGTPVIAQGGIGPDNAGLAIAAGARGVAVTGAILHAEDPARATRALRGVLDA